MAVPRRADCGTEKKRCFQAFRLVGWRQSSVAKPFANLDYEAARKLLISKLSDRLMASAVAAFYGKYIVGTRPPRSKDDRAQVLLDLVATQ